MKTAIQETQKQELTDLQPNYFQQYGQIASQNSAIIGTLLKFNKGDWLSGPDEDEVKVGTKFTALMDQLTVGWIKWVDGKPEQMVMGKVSEGYQPPRRKELGDDDEASWEVDNDGRPRDPWQFSNNLILRTPGTPGTEDSDLYTFATSSRGGINAIGELCKVYGKTMREKPDELPVFEVNVDSYNHSNKEFGRIKIPLLNVVGWEPKVITATTKAKASKAKAK